MGAWGLSACENDGAMDWFGDLWDQFPIPAKVEETLRLEVSHSHEDVRAAAYLLIQLERVWPADLCDRHYALAARRLEEIKGMEIYADDAFQVQLQKEIDILRSLISTAGFYTGSRKLPG